MWIERCFTLPLMNSFNKTEAAFFPMQAIFPEGFLFSQLNWYENILHIYTRGVDGVAFFITIIDEQFQ